MVDPIASVKSVDDRVGAVAVVHVAVKDSDALGAALGTQRARRDHETIEGAEPTCVSVPSVVETRAGSGDDAAVPESVSRG